MGGSITFDDSLWPLLLSRFQGVVSDAQYEEYLSRGLAYLQRGELYVSVLDMFPSFHTRADRIAIPLESDRILRTRSNGKWIARGSG